MSYVLAAGVVAAFALVVERLTLPDRAREVVSTARRCAAVLRDAALDDDEKERRLRRHTVELLRLFGVLAGGSVLALGLPLLGVWLLDAMGVASLPTVLGVLEEVEFLLASAALGTGAYLLFRRLRRS